MADLQIESIVPLAKEISLPGIYNVFSRNCVDDMPVAIDFSIECLFIYCFTVLSYSLGATDHFIYFAIYGKVN